MPRRIKQKPKEPSKKKNTYTGASMSGLDSALLALESRIMFDGAAAATGGEVAGDQVAQDQAEAAVNPEAGGEASSQETGEQDSLIQALATHEPQSNRREIIFIDTSVEDYQTLISGIDSNAEVVLLNSMSDGIEQIAQVVSERNGIDAIHIVSHGDQAELRLGTSVLTIDSMNGKYADELAIIGGAMSDSADFLIYGCNFGEGESGNEAATLLAELTGADIAASSDITGAEALGGDWDLEVRTGTIESEVIVDKQVQEEYAGVLDITSGLKGYWTFDADATDSSAEGNDGTLHGDAAIDTTDSTDIIGEGKLSLDGIGDYVDLSTHTGDYSGISEGTIAGWVNLTATSNRTIFDIGDGAANSNYVSFFVNNGQLRVTILDGGSTVLDVESSATINDGTWHHVAFTTSSSGNQLFIDGLQLTGGALTYNTGSSATTTFIDDLNTVTNTTIGAFQDVGISGEFQGLLDEVRVYDRALSSSDVAELTNLAPTDLEATATTDGGLSLNEDGGNDAYLIADDGSAIIGGLTSLTAEVRFSMDSFSNSTNFFSYATAGDDNVFKFNIRDDGDLSLSINSVKVNSSAMDYRLLADGSRHTLSVTWNSTGGVWEMFVDGYSMDSGSGLETGVTLAGGGTLVMGNDQDSVDGGYDPAAEVAATLYDARIFNDVRTSTEIGDNYYTTVSSSESGLVANWTFNDLTTNGVVTDTVTGNDLTVKHASGGGFVTSTPVLTLEVNENVTNGTVVGTVLGTDPEGDSLIYTLTDDASGRFTIDSNTGVITVADGSLLNYEANTSHNITVRINDGILTYDEVYTIDVNNLAEGIIVVDTTNDTLDGDTDSLDTLLQNKGADGKISLREAIEASNNTSGTDTINFNILDALVSGAHTIDVLSALPDITDAVIIDGTSEPDFGSTPIIELDGSSAGSVDGLRLTSGSDGSTIRSLVINQFGSQGIEINNSDGNTIAGNYIGTDVAGTVDLGNGSAGIYIFSAQNNTIGGTTAADRNVISGNQGSGILRQGSNGGNLIQGNYIGTDATGALDLGNTQNGIAFAGSGADTIGGTVAGAGNVISGNNMDGISIGAGADGVTIQGNHIGTNAAGTGAVANTGDGISLSSDTNQIGGTTALSRNVISGNTGDGLQIAGDSNIVEGNYIGTNAAGTAFLGNGLQGIFVTSNVDGNTIGGTVAGAGNIISGNDEDGIRLDNATNTTIQGNYVGLNAAGTAAIGNSQEGINLLNTTTGTTIGGTMAGAGNVVSGNAGEGILIGGSSTGTVVQGNYIGTDAAGTADVGNASSGINISADGITVGGTNSSAQNIISGNAQDGITISGASNTVIQGNSIGTDVTGTVDLGNSDEGIELVSATNTTIGGSVVDARNVIAGNTAAGIRDDGSSGTTIQGNYIGVDSTGTATLANSQGIQTWGGSSNGVIGGSGANEGNVIGGNTNQGILLYSSSGYTVQGNYIGTESTGTQDLGNLGNGIVLSTSSTNHLIGGTGVGEGNVIAFNDLDGIAVSGSSATGNSFLGNQVYSNADLGIDLSGGTEDGFGVTANDVGDADTGANNLQNYPVLTAADIESASAVTIIGSLNSMASTDFRIEFFRNTVGTGQDGSGYGEGEDYLGFVNVTTDGSGNATISTTLSAAVVSGEFITATATVDLGGGNYGETSEFGLNVVAAADNDVPVITNLASDNLAYTEGDGVVVIDQTTVAAVSDVDSSNFDTGTLTVSFTAGSDSAEDVLSIRHQGTGAGQIGVSGSNVTYAGTTIGTFTGGSGGTDLVITLNTNADATATGALVQNITYENTDTANPTTGTRTVRYVLTDGDGGTSANYDTTVTFTPVNDQSAVDLNGADGGGNDFSTTFTEGSGAVNVTDTDATVSDVDNTTYDSIDLNLGGFVDGSSEQITIAGYTFTFGTAETVVRTVGSTDFNIDFDGSGFSIQRDISGEIPEADLQTFIRGITYENISGAPTIGDRIIDFIPRDGDALIGLTSTSTITVAAVNDVPTITNLASDNLAYTEGDGAVVIDQTTVAAVSDVDSSNFDTGTLTVSFTAGSDSAEDVVAIRHQGTGAGQIGVSGSNVTYAGTTIGTFTGGSGGTDLVITLNTNADATATSALVQNITYENTDTANPTLGTRTVRYVLTDGDGGTSANYDTTVTFTAANDVPVITNLASDNLAYTEGDGAVVIDQTTVAAVSDVDSSNFDTGTLTVSFTAGSDSAEDVVAIRHQGTGAGQIGVSGSNVTYAGTTIGTFTGGSGGTDLVITLNTNADATATSALVQNITYENTDTANPTLGTRTVRYVLTDGDGGTSANYDTTVTFTAANDVPVITNLASDNLAYTEGDGAVVIDQTTVAAVSDVDSSNFDTGTLTVSFTAGSDSAEDVVAIRHQGTGAGQIGVSGSNVTYAGTTIGTFTGGSGGTDLVITLNTNADATATSALVQNITYENTDTANPTLGTRTVRYVLTDGDGGTSANYDTTVTFTAANDVPVITNLASDNLAYTEGDGAVVIDQTTVAAVSDVDSSNFDTGTLTVSFTAGSDSAEDVVAIRHQGTGAGQIGVSGSNVTYAGTTIGTFTGGSGGTDLVITLNTNADATATSALVQNITYENTDTANPTLGTRTVRYVLTDGDGGTSANYDTTVTFTAANDVPVITNLASDNLAYTEGDGAVVIDQTTVAAVSDVDSSNFDTGTLTVSFTAGSDSAEDVVAIRHQGTGAGQIGVSGSNVTYAGTTIGTFTGGSGGTDLVITLNTNADATATSALVQNITYENTDTANPTLGTRTVRYVLTDGDGGTSANYDTVEY